MKIRPLQGEFSSNDALEIITKMIHLQIKYHENKMNLNSSEEEILFRKTEVNKLHKELYDLSNNIEEKRVNIKLDANVKV